MCVCEKVSEVIELERLSEQVRVCVCVSPYARVLKIIIILCA